MSRKYLKNPTILGDSVLIKSLKKINSKGMTKVLNKITNTYEDVDASLELQGADGGLLFNRMSEVERDALNATDGMKVYVTDGSYPGFWSYTEGNWTPDISGGGGGGVSIVTGTANQINVANGTTAPVLSLPTNMVAPGDLNVTGTLTTKKTALTSSDSSEIPTNATDSIVAYTGDIAAPNGNVYVGGYNLATAKAVISPSGDISAIGGGITAKDDISTSTGNIISGGSITAANGLNVTTGTINAPNSTLSVKSLSIDGAPATGNFVESITAGSNVTITGTAANPIINSTGGGGGGISSVSGTPNQINVANGTTAPVLSLPTNMVAPGTLDVAGDISTVGGKVMTNAIRQLTPSGTLTVGVGGSGIVNLVGSAVQVNGAPIGGGGGIISVTGTPNQINVANGTTAPVLSFPDTVLLPGTLQANGNIGTIGGYMFANNVRQVNPADTLTIGSVNSGTVNLVGSSVQVNGNNIGTGGNVVGPSTSTVNNVALFADTTGTLLKDGGPFRFTNIKLFLVSENFTIPEGVTLIKMTAVGGGAGGKGGNNGAPGFGGGGGATVISYVDVAALGSQQVLGVIVGQGGSGGYGGLGENGKVSRVDRFTTEIIIASGGNSNGSSTPVEPSLGQMIYPGGASAEVQGSGGGMNVSSGGGRTFFFASTPSTYAMQGSPNPNGVTAEANTGVGGGAGGAYGEGAFSTGGSGGSGFVIFEW